jgi:hypothetical protein
MDANAMARTPARGVARVNLVRTVKLEQDWIRRTEHLPNQ